MKDQNFFLIVIILIQDMESLKDRLSKCFTNQLLIQLISAQVQRLNYFHSEKVIGKYFALTLKIPSHYKFDIYKNQIEFLVVLTQGFPYSPPRLHIRTGIVSPGFNDCRNLLNQVLIPNVWTMKTELVDLENSIVKYLANLSNIASPGINFVSRIGQFKMNMVYPIELLRQIRGSDIYFAFQYSDVLKMYVVDVCSTHLILFMTQQQPYLQNNIIKIPNQHQITSSNIVFVAELASIIELNANRVNFKEIQIKFGCKKPVNMQLTQAFTTKKLNSRKGGSILAKVLQNLNRFQLLDVKIQLNPNLQTAEEKKLISQMKKAQSQLERKFNSKTIQKLHECYQTLIEHFNNNNIPYYQIFVQKITILFQRPDVQLIMQTSKIQSNQQQNKTMHS